MPESQDSITELQGNASAHRDHVDGVLSQWAAARPDLDTAPVGAIARLGRATAYVDAGVNAKLEEFGLTREAWDVLASLRREDPPHRLSPTRLYQALMRSSGAMTHRLASLERAGLVRRLPDPGDGRGRLVELTRKGVKLVDRVAPAHLANERRLLAPLSDDERRQLTGLLRKLLHAYERDDPVPPPSGRGGRPKGPRTTRRRAPVR
jgi:DNA-binding MarR family transcriptional regulator